jgi:urease accessory protein
VIGSYLPLPGCGDDRGPSQSRATAVAVSGLVALVVAGSASAHGSTGLAGGFAYGFRHPFTGGDHLLAMVCVGVWGAFLGRPMIYALPVVFPLMMVGGAALGMIGVPLPPLEAGIALSVLVLGGCVAWGWRAPAWAATLVVAAFAIFHGYAHGRELPAAADPFGYSSGFVFATGALHVLGIGIGFLGESAIGIVAMRIGGGGVGFAGAWFLYRAFGP